MHMQGVLVGVHAPGVQFRDRGEVPRPRQFEWGKSSRQQAMVHVRPEWDVDRFLKNSGTLFTEDTNLDVAIDWFDGTEVVLD